MIYQDEYSITLTKKLKKLKKKNFEQFQIIMKKRDEILEDPLRYKNLKYNLSDRKSVHIDKHFVLTFKVDILQIRAEYLSIC